MAEAVEKRRRKKEQKVKDFEETEDDIDITEGIPDVSDLKDLLDASEETLTTNDSKQIVKDISKEFQTDTTSDVTVAQVTVTQDKETKQLHEPHESDLADKEEPDSENISSVLDTSVNLLDANNKQVVIQHEEHAKDPLEKNEQSNEIPQADINNCRGKLYPDLTEHIRALDLDNQAQETEEGDTTDVSAIKDTTDGSAIEDPTGGSTTEVTADTPRIEVTADVPTIEVTADTPAIEVTADAPTIEVTADAPTIEVTAENISALSEQLLTETEKPSEQILALKEDHFENEDSAPAGRSSAPEHEARGAFAPPVEELDHRERIGHIVVEERERQDEFQPLTREQLNSLYYNMKLENNTAYIDKFIQAEMKRTSHEFYEILMSYQRARKHLLQCEAALKTYEEDYRKSQDEVWITETCTSTAKGTCGEGYHCSATHTFQKCKVDYNALSRMTISLKNIQEKTQNDFSLHSYAAQLSKLQVESYIHDLFASSADLRNIPKNFPVHGCEKVCKSVDYQTERLRGCLSVLFVFHRLPIDDEEMIENLQIWTERMVSALLRVGTFEDHLFLLNHIMRCPAGIGSWASHFVQTPPIPSNEDHLPLMFGNANLDHVMTSLSTVLIPTSYRSEFMVQMQKMLQSGKDNKNISWVMVDSDGEEDEDPQNAWMYLHENDVVAILRQLSLATIFRHVFFVLQPPGQDVYQYDILKTSESTMYRVFAFSTCLVGILGNGLKTYGLSRYRQLNKRLGRTIRQCVQLVSDHWENFQDANQGMLSAISLQKLQVEYDAFFLRAVNFIHMSQRLGSWQYIGDMPFGNISKTTMWKILWLLHQGQESESCDITFIPPAGECMIFVQDPSCRSQLSDILLHVPTSEGVYLLNTMTNMVQCCSSAQIAFIETVTMAIFEVSFICAETRDICSKMGRELLSEVVTCHPFMLSVLIQRVHEYMGKLGQMGLYLFKGLSLETWLPTDPDLVIIRQWLLNSNLGSPENQIAMQILSRINWGTSLTGDRLMVPWRVHKQVAVLVVEAYQRFIHGKHLGSMIMEGVKQMSAVVQQSITVEQEFNSWCWTLLLKLSLHQTSLPQEDRRLARHSDVPDLNQDDSLLPLYRGIKEKNPMACYVSLVLTKYGHSVEHYISDGIPLLEVLIVQGLFKPTISALYFTCLMFISNQKYLLDSVRLQEVVLSILRADESYFKVVKGLLSYDFPGPITKLFTSMILSQIELYGKNGNENLVSAIQLWTVIILQLPRWHQDRNCHSVLDHLIQAAFTNKPALNAVKAIFTEQYKGFCNAEKNQGVVSSIMSWVTSGVSLPSYLEKSSCGEFSWLTYIILWLEGNYELETKLWPTIQEDLLNQPKAGTEHCLKKAISKLKLDQAPVWSRLNIMRWAQQALDMPLDHPVAVLVWQRFFILYLGRLNTTQIQSPQRASVGERFFTSLGYASMPKKMKKKLGKTADFYLKLSGESSVDEESDEERVSTRKEHLYRLARLYQTFQFWVEEPLLHDGSLYLPSLPPQYQSEKLLTVFQNHIDPWTEYLDMREVSTSLETLTTVWKQTGTPDQNPKTKEHKDTNQKKPNGAERILTRLSRCDEPLPAPPVHPVKAPVPEIPPSIMENKAAILHLVENNIRTLIQYAGRFCTDMVKLKKLDDTYIDLLPDVYTNIVEQVTLELKCTSMMNPLHKCAKPGAVTIQIEEKKVKPIIQHQVDENRAEYKHKVIECRVPLSNNSVTAAVHTENAITLLVKLSRQSTDDRRYAVLSDIATNLFFHLGQSITDNVLEYPPTKQFFASCIDVLGKEFIQVDKEEAEHVLHMALARLDLGGMFAPHFKPNLNPVKFVDMYGQLAERLQGGKKGGTPSSQGVICQEKIDLQVVSMLLTKFDVHDWLTVYRPSKQEVQKFIDHLSVAFVVCGTQPQDGLLTLFKLYLRHEKKLLAGPVFPRYLNQVLAALLQGSSVQRINVECWEVLLNHCFQSTDHVHEGHQYSDIVTHLSLDEIRNLLLWLGREFMQMRTNKEQASTFGLYPKWKLYVPYLSQLLRDLSKCLVDKMLPNLTDGTDGAANEGIERIWSIVLEGFGPWLQTVMVKKVVSQPWIAEDRDTAAFMVQALVHVVGYAHQKTNGIQHRFYNNFLSHLWLYFSTTLCKDDVSPDVVAVFNLEFVKLPWQHYTPNIHVIETMAGLQKTGCSLGFNLVSDVMSMINWNLVWNFYERHYDHEGQVRFQGCLFLLLIQAFTENKHIENPDMEQLLTQGSTYQWLYLLADDFKKASSWLLQSCDPTCLLKGRTAPGALGIRLLESASGFNPEISVMLTEECTSKRLTYLHSLTSLICQCTYQTDCDYKLLSTYIINLLTQIETVESAVVDSHPQHEESTDMMKEILSLLNNSNPDNEGVEVIMAAIFDWLQGSPQTILLSPCIRAATRNLASLQHMAQIVEQCIQLAFVPGGQRVQVADPWNGILAAIEIPELNLTEFFNACLQESSFLLLYSYVLQRIPLCQSLTEERGIIEVMLDWCDQAKPSADNESKLLLWWYKAVDLILRQVDYGQEGKICVTLVQKLISKVTLFGEDRASAGLLGAIGLGKKSQLSERFRACSRALVALCSCQIISEDKLRRNSEDYGSPLSAAKQDIHNLLSIKTNKKYQPIKAEVELTCDYVTDQSKCLRDAIGLLILLRDTFYPSVHYLSVIKA